MAFTAYESLDLGMRCRYGKRDTILEIDRDCESDVSSLIFPVVPNVRI